MTCPLPNLSMSIVDGEHIPMPVGLDTEEESPYRRRQKAVAVRRGRFSRLVRRLLRWAPFGAFMLLLVGYVGYHMGTFALTSPLFMLKSAEDIVLRGNRFVSRAEILNALGIHVARTPGTGMNVFRLSLEEKRRQVESIPWVQSATLTRSYPHHLAVHVAERTPLAFVNVGGCVKLVDSEGVLLDKPEKAGFDFPVLAGLDSVGRAERKLRLDLYQEFTQQLTGVVPQAGWLVSEVDLADVDDLRALLVQGHETIQVHFGHQDFRERFQNFLALLPEVRKTNPRIDSVDLRYHNQVVVNPQQAGLQDPGVPDRRPRPAMSRGDSGRQKE